jgi:hypothetical protein
VNNELLAALKKLKKECVRVIPVKPGFANEMADEIRFAGPAYAEAADKKPVCPDCGNELSFVFQFRQKIDNGGKADGPLHCFFYCFKCMPIGRQKEETGQWLLRTHEQTAINKFVPGHGVDKDLAPCSCELSMVHVLPDYEVIEAEHPDIAAICEDIDSDDPLSAYEEAGMEIGCEMEPFTSIGGYPHWIQGEGSQTCPVCGKNMQFICQIDSEAAVELMWGDAGCLYLFQCQQHPREFAMEMQCF